MHHHRTSPSRLAGLALLILSACSASAFGQPVPSHSELVTNRNALVDWLANAAHGVEFYTESKPSEDGADTTIALIVEGIDVQDAGSALVTPAAWCEVMFLHLNVKSCVSGENDEGQWMRMFMGRKYYQHPRKAKQIELQFASGSSEDGVKWVTLSADEGPFNTSDYFVGLYAIEADNGTYAQLRSSQKTGKAIAGAMNLYFKTLASNKIGFSVVGQDRRGNPEYSTGTQAMLERNVVRYLLALRTYMQTPASGVEGMRQRTAAWYDATERYTEQLREVDRDDYLRDKEKEYQHQLEMQLEVRN